MEGRHHSLDDLQDTYLLYFICVSPNRKAYVVTATQ